AIQARSTLADFPVHFGCYIGNSGLLHAWVIRNHRYSPDIRLATCTLQSLAGQLAVSVIFPVFKTRLKAAVGSAMDLDRLLPERGRPRTCHPQVRARHRFGRTTHSVHKMPHCPRGAILRRSTRMLSLVLSMLYGEQ